MTYPTNGVFHVPADGCVGNHSPVTDPVTLPSWDEPQLPPFPGRMVRAGRHVLHVRHTPVGPGAEPAVYVHGLGGSSTNWTDVMHLLSPRLAGTAVDLPGFGLSPPPYGDRYGIDDHVGAVVAYLRASGGHPVHLVGHSLGGTVALRLAAENPRLVRTLTLLAPGLPGPTPKGPLQSSAAGSYLPLLLVPGVRQVVAHRLTAVPTEVLLQQAFGVVFGDPGEVHPQRRAEALAELHDRRGLLHRHDAFLSSMRDMVMAAFDWGPRNLWRQAGRLQMPTLLIFGRHDQIVDVRAADRARRAVPRNGVVVLEHAGHMLPMERPELVATAVRTHLDILDERAGRSRQQLTG